MTAPNERSKVIFQAIGLCSPYLAVILGIWFLKNALAATLFYHAVLLICIYGITRFNIFGFFLMGFKWSIGLVLCLGGIIPGIVILCFWPAARLDGIDLAKMMTLLKLYPLWFLFFAIYACLINPLLEEAFWRGCFRNQSFAPDFIDVLFSGYHALAVTCVIRAPFVVFVFLAMVGVGWLFRLVYRKTGGLLIPLLTHCIADIAILYAVWKII